MIDPAQSLFRIRLAIGLFMAGLALSGGFAFPLLNETEVLTPLVSRGGLPPGPLGEWLMRMRDGLHATHRDYPFITFQTDWLAFTHVILALFFLGPMSDPVRNVFVLYAGLWGCALVFPLALIFGPLRGVPFAWRMVDCAFGLIGAVPLLYAIRQTHRLAASSWMRFEIPR